jgi:general secretion pathway protein G
MEARMPIGNKKTRHSGFRIRISTGVVKLTQRRIPKPDPQGFTLLELMVALSVVLILASFAIPAYYIAIQRAREAVLRQDLYTLRSLIDEFTVDKQRPPATLQELVEAGYLRGGIPVDPVTGSSESWHVDIEDVPGPDQTQPGVVDVHSGSDDMALDGTPYNSW